MQLLMDSRGARASRYRVAPLNDDSGGVSPTLLLAVSSLSDAAAVRPRWMNLDAAVNSPKAMALLVSALAAQKPNCSVETLSLRHCRLGDVACLALCDLISSNTSIETVYLHMAQVSDAFKVKLEEAWRKHGVLHVVRAVAGSFSLMRKKDTAYQAVRHRLIPAWALLVKAPVKKKKKKKKKAKKK
ncbi:hypothetical protein M885DRAFT_536000 [Pelagophyceae sp. CCMP2097]|nr:hypothetical protein M885DRAFT_536000 [Pelagophyceae sp. CCMP2097]|mmetsp:Transcript_2035/g.7434  ORF Transcript_2035/g.7434 Transcript_2035/m.7434 type:complete len:186 (-) Transcript_2035:17-574(-)